MLFSVTGVDEDAHAHQHSVVSRSLWPRRGVLAAAFCCAMPLTAARAQGLHVTQPPPDCNLGRVAYDNPFGEARRYKQARVLWHLEYAAGSLAVSYVLHRVVHLPWWASAGVTVGLGVAPHIRGGVLQRKYPINPGDWVFDFWDRAVPAIWAANHHDEPQQSKVRNLGASFEKWLAGYAATACFASP